MTEPDDSDRYPTLTDAGRGMLRRLVEHEAAPIYRNRSGNRLKAEDIAGLRDFEREVIGAPIGWQPGAVPDWVMDLVGQVYAQVPHYRRLGPPPRRLADIETVSRAEFAADIAAFVPDTVPTDRMINFRTTGTTGHPLLVASHPVVAARYSAFHKRALKRFGIVPQAGAGEVGVMLLGYQRRCFTYVSVTPTMGESGLAKINLHPADWRDPGDPARYIDAMRPEIIAGDPISFAALLDLPVTARPCALMSVSMMLTRGLRRQLEDRFGCPVLDIYSMNEVGPIAVHDEDAGGHVLLQPHLYVEIVDAGGQALPMGQRGEVCVTGGFNFCLPLIRYRTGDFAALGLCRGEPILLGLSGRRPVRYRTAAGEWLNNIDVSHAMKDFPAAQFGLHQAADGAVSLRVAPHAMAHAAQAQTILRALFGDLPLDVVPIDVEDKIIQYTSDLPGASAA